MFSHKQKLWLGYLLFWPTKTSHNSIHSLYKKATAHIYTWNTDVWEIPMFLLFKRFLKLVAINFRSWVVVFFFSLLPSCMSACWRTVKDHSEDLLIWCCSPGTAGYAFFLSLLPFLASGLCHLAVNWLRKSIQPNSLGDFFFFCPWLDQPCDLSIKGTSSPMHSDLSTCENKPTGKMELEIKSSGGGSTQCTVSDNISWL